MNINQLMKQAQQMQKKLLDAQAQVEQMEVEGSAGGGMVKVIMNGKGYIKSAFIDAKLLDPSEKETVEDLFAAAVNNANTKREDESNKKMGDLTGGMNLPAGLKLPF